MDTTRNETRSDTLREQNLREEEWTYEEPDALTIPAVVQARYDNEGMALRWIRISLKGQDDITNVGKKTTAGWVFVTPEEVPEMGSTSVVREEGRYAGVVSRGDIALGKIPTVKLEAKRRHYRNKANEMLEAVNAQLMNSSNSKMPISNNSKSRTFKGRTPTFQD